MHEDQNGRSNRGELVGRGFDVPDVVRESVEWHWFHVAPGGMLELVVLSTEPVWYVGHFVGGRMQRCGGDDCRLCAEEFGRQIRYVVAVGEISTRQVGLVELGRENGLLLAEWCKPRVQRALDGMRGVSGLRGMVIELSRAGKSKHAPLRMTLQQVAPPGWYERRTGPDLQEALRRTWERMSTSGPITEVTRVARR